MLPLLLILALAACCGAHGARFELEHSFDGGATFVPSATVQGMVVEGGELSVMEVASSTEGLAALIEDDGFYVVRVGSASTSIRAACLASGATSAVVELSLGVDSSVMALSYQLVGRPSGGPCVATGAPTVPPTGRVVVKRPVEGPMVMPPHIAAAAENIMFGGNDQPMPTRQSGGGGGGPTGRPTGQPPSGEGEAGAEGGADARAPVKEKTWWEKNWMLSAGISMAVFNIVGKFMQNGLGAAPAGAAAGGGAVAARPAAAGRK
ncbi:hypothetical protein FOA52_006764 [Chlamydomonas sp. UWO 241]|nr:hypothetical protein FOA52_006764 [Chlamydomonas sp. UWO 241]